MYSVSPKNYKINQLKLAYTPLVHLPRNLFCSRLYHHKIPLPPHLSYTFIHDLQKNIYNLSRHVKHIIQVNLHIIRERLLHNDYFMTQVGITNLNTCICAQVYMFKIESLHSCMKETTNLKISISFQSYISNQPPSIRKKKIVQRKIILSASN